MKLRKDKRKVQKMEISLEQFEGLCKFANEHLEEYALKVNELEEIKQYQTKWFILTDTQGAGLITWLIALATLRIPISIQE